MYLAKKDKPDLKKTFIKKITSFHKKGFLLDLKFAVMHNKFIKIFIIAGLLASIFDTLYYTNILMLLEWAGQIAGAIAISNALKGNQPILYKNLNSLHWHIGIGIALTLIGLALGSAVMALPYSHIWQQLTITIMFTGINSLFEAGIEKYRRNH